MPMWKIQIDSDAAREIKKLPADLQARFLRAADLIEEFGPELLPPKAVKHIEGDIWELRLKDRSGIARVFYFTVHPKRMIVLSAFKKTTQKTPKRELDKARTRRKVK